MQFTSLADLLDDDVFDESLAEPAAPAAATSPMELMELDEFAEDHHDDVVAVENAVNAGFREGFNLGQAEGMRSGFMQGHAEGLEAGRSEAREVAVEEFRSQLIPGLRALDEAVAQLESADAVTLRAIESEVVDLAFAVVRALLDRELQLDTHPVRESIRRAMALAPDRGSIVVRVNPNSLSSIGEVADFAPARHVELVADPDIEPAGCVVEVGACRIDAQLRSALERVRGVLGASTGVLS